jgi:hypothetical protein
LPTLTHLYDSQGEATPQSYAGSATTMEESNPTYRVFCLGDRSAAVHYGPGSRTETAAEIFRSHPAP